jgi:nicotinamidase-related amidase
MSIAKLDRAQTQVLLIDIQEKLCAAMPEKRLVEVLGRAGALLEGARVLGLPILATEQYPRGLGPTHAHLKSRVEPARIVEKVEFTAFVPGVEALLGSRRQVLITGMETHICVFQTVRDLALKGYLPVLCADAVLSRSERDFQVGLDLCREAGAMVTTVESALFDLLGRAGTPEFKAISAAVK